MNHIHNQPFENIFRTWENQLSSATTGFSVDIAEEENSFQIRADLPGVSKDKVDISVQDNVLSLIVDFPAQRKDGKTLHSERLSGRVKRTFRLSRDVDSTNIDAELKDGVLTLLLPKSEAAGKRQIVIQ